MKCHIYGYWESGQPSSSSDALLYKLIEEACGECIEFTTSLKDAELVILMPYLSSKIRRWALAQLYFRKNKEATYLLNAIFRIKSHQKVLAVTYENLDHRSWYWFGKLIRQLNIPRLTFWPDVIDSGGCRFPYWWNFVRFENYILSENAYERYGVPLELDRLLSPLDIPNQRIDAVCVLTRHLRWPRDQQLQSLEKNYQVDVYQHGTNRQWDKTKFELLQKYKYAFAAENSIGYGYETEKLPEAWMAGCIPVGHELNPFSDFRKELNQENDRVDDSCFANFGMLNNTPNLTKVVSYISERVFKP